jgi:hypothetical protein
MSCQICEIHERDLKDVARELEKRRIAQTSVLAGTRGEDLALEIRALASAKAEIEAKYSKHRKSGAH